MGTFVAVARQREFGQEIHRIGPATPDNFALKAAELKLSPPGISVILGGSAVEAAMKMCEAFPNATQMLAQTRIVSSTRLAFLHAIGFSVMPAPSQRLPDHGRIYHPSEGIDGFDEEGRMLLSLIFTETIVP